MDAEHQRAEGRMSSSSGIPSNMDNVKLEWMYKNKNELINREEYLLGRAVDKTFEQLQQEELRKEREQKMGVKQPLNHVEHDCVPFSIRDYKNLQIVDQVDLQRKVMEDPLVLIKQREMETRRKILENPVKLKELHRMLAKNNVGAKNKKKTKNKKKAHKYKKPKKNLSLKYPQVTNEGELDQLLIKELMESIKDGRIKKKAVINQSGDLNILALAAELDKAIRRGRRELKKTKNSRKKKSKKKKRMSSCTSNNSRSEQAKNTKKRDQTVSSLDKDREYVNHKKKSIVSHAGEERTRSRSPLYPRGNRDSNCSKQLKFKPEEMKRKRRSSSTRESKDITGEQISPIKKNRKRHDVANSSRSPSRSNAINYSDRRRPETKDSKRKSEERSHKSRREDSRHSKLSAESYDQDKHKWVKKNQNKAGELTDYHRNEEKHGKYSESDRKLTEKTRDQLSLESGENWDKRRKHITSRAFSRSTSREKQQRHRRRSRSYERSTNNEKHQDKEQCGHDREKDKFKSPKRSMHRDKYQKHSDSRTTLVDEKSDRRCRTRSRSPNVERKYKGSVRPKTHSSSRAKQAHTRRHESKSSDSNLKESERNAKLQEMMKNAEWREQERSSTVQRHRDDAKEEEQHNQKRDCDSYFFKEIKKAINNYTSIESRLGANVNNIQRNAGAMDSNFARK